METIFTKAGQLINESKNALIIPGEEVCGDSLGTAIALREILQKSSNNKTNFDAYMPDVIPPQLNFLLEETEMERFSPLSKNIIISINNESNNISSLRYMKKNGKLNIIISPRNKKVINKNDLNIKMPGLNYDLIITVCAQSQASLGEIYENNHNFFLKTPVINIDHHKDNQQFGDINIVNDKFASTAEIIMEFADCANYQITKKSATCLLCGIIEKTQSFQKPDTTPDALRAASKLINLGGDQELIVRNLYKTKSINMVRLWGELMKELKYDQHKKIVSSIVTRETLEQNNADASIFRQLLKELKMNFAKCEYFFILWNSADSVNGIFTGTNLQTVKEIGRFIESKIRDDILVFRLPEENPHKAEAFFFNLINRHGIL